MITIPWLAATMLVMTPLVIIVLLVLQLSSKADRDTQRSSELIRQTRRATSEGIKEGHEIYLEMHDTQKLKQKLRDAKT